MVDCSCFNQGYFANLNSQSTQSRIRRRTRGGPSSTAKRRDICGHEFETKTFLQPRICSQCHCFIWGFARQGYQCKECNLVIHKRCFDKDLPVCKKAEDATLPQLTYDQLMFIVNNTNLIEKETYRKLNIRRVPHS